MMRFHSTSTFVLASLIGIPAIALRGQDGLGSLAGALEATEQAIADLAGIKKGLEAHDDVALERLIEATEAPVSDSAERAKRIEELQREVDALSQRVATRGTGSGAPSTGLTPAQLAAIGMLGPASGAESPQTETDSGEPEPAVVRPVAVALEAPGFSADELARARLYVRVGRAHEALEVLAGLEDTPAVRYWRARATSETGQKERAIEMFNELAGDEDGGKHSTWARHDARVLSFELELARRSARKDGTTVKTAEREEPGEEK